MIHGCLVVATCDLWEPCAGHYSDPWMPCAGHYLHLFCGSLTISPNTGIVLETIHFTHVISANLAPECGYNLLLADVSITSINLRFPSKVTTVTFCFGLLLAFSLQIFLQMLSICRTLASTSVATTYEQIHGTRCGWSVILSIYETNCKFVSANLPVDRLQSLALL